MYHCKITSFIKDFPPKQEDNCTFLQITAIITLLELDKNYRLKGTRHLRIDFTLNIYFECAFILNEGTFKMLEWHMTACGNTSVAEVWCYHRQWHHSLTVLSWGRWWRDDATNILKTSQSLLAQAGLHGKGCLGRQVVLSDSGEDREATGSTLSINRQLTRTKPSCPSCG